MSKVKGISMQNKLTLLNQLSIVQYLQEIKTDKYDVLTKEQEALLFAELRATGSLEVRDRILNANMRWGISMAKQYEGKKAQLGDLINEASIAMMEAIEKFDESKNVKFYIFSTNYIRTGLNTYVNETIADGNPPANRYRINKLVKDSVRNLSAVGIFEPTNEDIVDEYEKIKKKVDPVLDSIFLEEIRNFSKGFVSASSTLNASGMEETELGDCFKSGAEYSADHAISSSERKAEINETLSSILVEREKVIVEHFFGLNGHEAKTLDQLVDVLGLTRERIGQIKDKALSKLKDHKKIMFELLGCGNDSIHSTHHREVGTLTTGLGN